MTGEKTILIVDDVESNIDILVDLLSRDFEIMVAMNGTECLEAVSKQKPEMDSCYGFFN